MVMNVSTGDETDAESTLHFTNVPVVHDAVAQPAGLGAPTANDGVASAAPKLKPDTVTGIASDNGTLDGRMNVDTGLS